MPRRKASTTTATTKTPLKAHKRQLSSSATPNTKVVTPGSRQSKRIKASSEDTLTANGAKTTLRKSKYFEGTDSDNEEDNQAASPEVVEEETSGYEDEDASASHATSATPSSLPSSDEGASESDNPSKKRGKKQVNKKQTAKGATEAQSTSNGIIEKGKELWRQGVKAGLGPGKAVYIEKPKPRGDGGIKYVPEKIHPNTMAFLGDLKANNEREWLKSE
jgi:hypothetical protein